MSTLWLLFRNVFVAWSMASIQSSMYRYDFFWFPSPRTSRRFGLVFSFLMKSGMTPWLAFGPTMLARRRMRARRLKVWA